MPPPAATGRPRAFCRQACRQRDYENRQRSTEVGLSESELIIARAELDDLYDQLYVLECAVEDVERDLAGTPSAGELRDAIAWLLQAAKPLATRRLGDRL